MTDTPLRMLVVDDEEPILFAMSEFFKCKGYVVDCASEKEEALALLRHKAYDVVIADLRLTGIHGSEGFDVVEFARGTQPSARILLLTAYGSPEVEEAATGRGADVLLQKPQPLPEIARVLSDLLAQPV